MTKLFCGHFILRSHAAPIPDNPAATIITSTCSTTPSLYAKLLHATVLARCGTVNYHDLSELDVAESILKAVAIYTKGKLVQEAGIETYYFLVSSKRAM